MKKDTKQLLLIGAGLVGLYAAGKIISGSSNSAKEGSLGGEDELLGQRGFDVDPNAPYATSDSKGVLGAPTDIAPTYAVEPTGVVSPSVISSPSGSPTGSSIGSSPSGYSASSPAYSTGTGSIVSDVAYAGGAIGTSLALPKIGKGISGAIDAKYGRKAATGAAEVGAESKVWKFLKDPYAVNKETSVIQSASDVVKPAEKQVGKIAGDVVSPSTKAATGVAGDVVGTLPKWAKITKGVANYIPLADVPIGAALDHYFMNKYASKPTDKITWGQAFKGNIAGEAAQLGVTAGAAVAGVGVGGAVGWVGGTAVDIAASEAYYRSIGKPSLFGQKQTKQPSTTEYGTTSGTIISGVFGVDPSKTNQPVSPVVQQTTTKSTTPAATSTSKTAPQSTSTPAKKVEPKVYTVSGQTSSGRNIVGSATGVGLTKVVDKGIAPMQQRIAGVAKTTGNASVKSSPSTSVSSSAKTSTTTSKSSVSTKSSPSTSSSSSKKKKKK